MLSRLHRQALLVSWRIAFAENRDRQTDRQTARQAGRQAGRPADGRTDRQTDRQTERHSHTDTQTHRHTDTQTHRHRHADTQTCRQTQKQTDWDARKCREAAANIQRAALANALNTSGVAKAPPPLKEKDPVE